MTAYFFATSLFVLLIVFFCGCVTGSSREPKWRSYLNCLIGIILSLGAAAFLTHLAPSLFYNYIANQNGEYYLPCEIVAKNDGCTFFATVDSENQEIFAAYTGDHEWPEDVPYLLHMDGKGTPDRRDDEILVVWRTD